MLVMCSVSLKAYTVSKLALILIVRPGVDIDTEAYKCGEVPDHDIALGGVCRPSLVLTPASSFIGVITSIALHNVHNSDRRTKLGHEPPPTYRRLQQDLGWTTTYELRKGFGDTG